MIPVPLLSRMVLIQKSSSELAEVDPQSQLIILVGGTIFAPPFPDDINMSLPTVSFSAQRDSGILCLYSSFHLKYFSLLYDCKYFKCYLHTLQWLKSFKMYQSESKWKMIKMYLSHKEYWKVNQSQISSHYKTPNKTDLWPN